MQFYNVSYSSLTLPSSNLPTLSGTILLFILNLTDSFCANFSMVLTGILCMFGLYAVSSAQTSLTTITLFRAEKTWNDAISFCQGKGMQLLEVRTKAKADVIDKIGIGSGSTWYNNYQDAWIGLHDTDSSTVLGHSWVQGCTPQTWSNWYSGEPLNHQSNKCIKMVRDGTQFRWRADTCGQKRRVLCEKTAGDCTFQQKSDSIGQGATADIQQTVDEATCKSQCLSTPANTEGECWAVTYTSATSVCTLYKATHPLHFDSNTASSPGQTLYMKRCYKDAYEGTNDVFSSDTSSDPKTGCREGEALTSPAETTASPTTTPATTTMATTTTSLTTSTSTSTAVPAVTYTDSTTADTTAADVTADTTAADTTADNTAATSDTTAAAATSDTTAAAATSESIAAATSDTTAAAATADTTAAAATSDTTAAAATSDTTAAAATADTTAAAATADTTAAAATSDTTAADTTSDTTAAAVTSDTTASDATADTTAAAATADTSATTGDTYTEVSTYTADAGVTTDPTNSLMDVCQCNCEPPGNKTVEELIEEIIAKLLVDKKTTSKSVRKKISVPDDRPSAQNIGYMGIGFLVITGMFFVLADAVRVCAFLTKKR